MNTEMIELGHLDTRKIRIQKQENISEHEFKTAVYVFDLFFYINKNFFEFNQKSANQGRIVLPSYSTKELLYFSLLYPPFLDPSLI